MTQQGKTAALIGRVEGLGLRLEYDSGFAVLRCPAAADLRKDDIVEMEPTFIELGKRVKEVFPLAIARARFARGKELLGRQAFISEIQALGNLTDVTEAGLLTLSYKHRNDRQERYVESTCCCRGDELLFIGALPDDPDRAASSTSTWPADDQTRSVLERCEASGLRFEHDSGFAVAKWPPMDDEQAVVAEAAMRRIGQRVPLVFRLVQGRARGKRARDFVGQRVFAPDLAAGAATVESCDARGSLVLSFRDNDGSRLMHWHQGERLLIVVDEKQPERAADSQSEGARGWLRRALGAK